MTSPGIDLKAHIANLRAKEAANPTPKADNALIFWGNSFESKFLTYLKPCVGSATVFTRMEPVTTISQVTMYCRTKKVTRVISSSVTLLAKVLHWDKRAAPSLKDYAGSYFPLAGFRKDDPDIELVFIAPLKQLVTVSYGRFMAKRLISKLTNPKKWYKPTAFTGFTLLMPENEGLAYNCASTAQLICIDTETLRQDAQIRCLSYTAFHFRRDTGEYISKSYVLPLNSDYALAIMRKWNLLPAPKIFQNGKYDIAYLARYNAPVHNYLYDTANLFHCWYSELPKDLGFLNAFFIREAVYWKDLSKTNDLQEYYKYNALDTWGTGNCFLAMLHEAPEYAINNYLLEFPLVFPCHLAEMTGIERDVSRLEAGKAGQDKIIEENMNSLNTILDIPEGQSFNVLSNPQMKQLLRVLGCSDLPNADAKALAKARFRHPFNARVINHILKVRKARKLVSTYLTPGKEFSRQDGTGSRILYSLNPHGTDTSRLASKEHHFWCGLQIQNIPKGPAVKQTLVADPGFLLCEVDLEQAESRDTGYLSGDPTLIDNVENSPDFHCSNASMFFGIPFEELYDIATGKVFPKYKSLRNDVGKRVNHGANYNMGPYVLIDTMGEEKILLAKHLLGLNRLWSYMQVAEYLLELFHKTFPMIREVYYKGLVEEIQRTRKLSSLAVHWSWKLAEEYLAYPEEADANYAKRVGKAWVRFCFADPSKSKSALNAYIAHPPQSLNAQTLNKSWLSVFHDIAIHPKHRTNFKLCAQIHDSILFQYRIGHDYLCDMVKERMEVPLTLKGYDGKIRTFVVPAGIKKGLHLDKQKAEYWSETE